MVKLISFNNERKQILFLRKEIPLGYQCNCNKSIHNLCNGLIPFSRFEWKDACESINITFNFQDYIRPETLDDIEKRYQCPFIGDTSNMDKYCKLINKTAKSDIKDRRPITCRIIDFKASLSCTKCIKRVHNKFHPNRLGIISSVYLDLLVNNNIIFDKILNPQIFIDMLNKAQNDIDQKIIEEKKDKEIGKSFLFQELEYPQKMALSSISIPGDNAYSNIPHMKF